jgi:hypothetical protein
MHFRVRPTQTIQHVLRFFLRRWVHSGPTFSIISAIVFVIFFPHTNTFFPGYIGEFEIIDDHRAGKIVIQLNGRLNKTGVISPRFNVQVTQIESWVNLLLPSRGFGIIILVCLSMVLLVF